MDVPGKPLVRLQHSEMTQKTCIKHGTVKAVVSGLFKIDKTKVFMKNGSLMQVESIAECSPWSIL